MKFGKGVHIATGNSHLHFDSGSPKLDLRWPLFCLCCQWSCLNNMTVIL